MHIRPYINLNQEEDRQRLEKIQWAVAELLVKHGGALSGEHGDGYIRSWLNKKLFDERLYQAFCDLKETFDPNDLMNPGKVVHGLPPLHDLRKRPQKTLDTFLDFQEEGGFELAVDLCNGNGLCRKKETLMCPSFQVTHDEYDTTRARAQALRAMIQGHLPKDSFASQEIFDVLDLCLQCRGCRSECPSQVDMGKMKSEFLYHYYSKHGYPLRTRLFGHIGKLNQWISPFVSIVNAMHGSKMSKWFLDLIGIAPERSLPLLAKERFSHWARRQPPKQNRSKRVLLFSDTYTEFHYPEVGQAAFKVLESLGYSVIVPKWSCCGRTYFSKGMLVEARKSAMDLLSLLADDIQEETPIVVLEPSCLYMLKEDVRSLLGQKTQVKQLNHMCVSLEEFLLRDLEKRKEPLPFKIQETSFLIHRHCYEKTFEGEVKILELFNRLPGCTAKVIDAGCCGMAGSFGFEKEHYDISMKIGSLKLFPTIVQSPPTTELIANGISCRQQIVHGTGRAVHHLAEVIAKRLGNGK